MRKQTLKSLMYMESHLILNSNVYFRLQNCMLTTGFAKGSSKKEPEDYGSGRSEVDLIRYVNSKAGTHRLEGGGLSEEAGRVAGLDELAKKLAVAETDAEEGYVYEELQQVLKATDSP